MDTVKMNTEEYPKFFYENIDLENNKDKELNSDSSKELKDDNLIYFFGYGLFLEKERLALETSKGERLIGPAFLPYHKLTFDLYATIEKSENKKDSVWGLLYLIEKQTLDMLDTIEGYPTYYNRKRMSVYTIDKAYDETWVYKMNPYLGMNNNKKQKPDVNYYNLILNKARELKFPNEYIRHIIRTVADM